ncbi:hypothetical protein HHI36_008620 [Cryptolaemus montrouzieri]|uniref:G-protein coupled receptors family 1 profile domain-containing protein n=1 Tax=Cryptolaemus montrouzieri TaxID=559131 RepID=A0ABD2MTV2_9CUCU
MVETIEHIDDCFKDNNLSLNIGKTQVLKFSYQMQKPDEVLTCGDLTAPQILDIKLLGMPCGCGIFLSVLIFLSVAGNILVCAAIYTDRGLRRIGNLFLASLAIADLFVASLVMTFAGVNDILGYWIFGAEFCDTWIAFDVMCSTASILNLCAISLDRYIHIKDPLSKMPHSKTDKTRNPINQDGLQ